MRNTKLTDLPLFFACQKRLSVVVRPHRELEHGAKGLILDLGHNLDLAVSAGGIDVSTAGLSVSGMFAVGPGQSGQIGGAHQGPGMPAALLRLELVAVARGATGGAQERGWLREEWIGCPESLGLFQG